MQQDPTSGSLEADVISALENKPKSWLNLTILKSKNQTSYEVKVFILYRHTQKNLGRGYLPD